MSNLEHAKKLMVAIEAAFDKVEEPLDIEVALQIAQVCTLMAQVEATQAQTEQLRRIADALSDTNKNAIEIAKAINTNNQYN